MPTWEKKDRRIEIRFDNNVTLELLLTDDGSLRGIGEVCFNGTRLRNGNLPLYPWLRSVGGMDYARFRFDAIDADGDGVKIKSTAFGAPRNEEAYGDQYNDHQFRVSQFSAPDEAKLEWILQPETIVLDALEYCGISYAWKFTSQSQKLHRIVAIGTWEIGGTATGNTILSQGQVTPAVYTAEKETRFTSACLITLRDFGEPQNMSFQWQPRLGVHQCFDFIASPVGSLLGYWPRKADIRSFVQKNPGEDVFFVVDAEHWQASTSVETSPKTILFAPSGEKELQSHDMRNRWYAANEFCCETARNHFGLKRSRPLPERTISYDQRLNEDGTFFFKVGEEWVRSQDWLAAIADQYLPNLARQGVKRVMAEPVSESDPTQRGLLRKLNSGIHGDLNVGSCCCTHRYRPAEFFGGMKAWRYYYEKAQSLGLQAGIWVGPHLASHSPILKEHPDWAIKCFTTLDYAGGYPNFELSAINLNTPIRQWILDDLKRWKEEGGLDYVWLDSFANLGMLPLDFSKEMQPNALAVAEFVAGIQKLGIEDIAVEGMSCLAMSGAHIMDVDPAITGGVQYIAGQNCWAWYEENEDMLYGQQPRVWIHKERSEENVRQRLFRCLANRCIPEMTNYVPMGGDGAEWYGENLRNYFVVENDMRKREILPDNQGVLWHNEETRILFAYRDFNLSLSNLQSAENVATGETAKFSGETLNAKAWSIYRMKLKA